MRRSILWSLALSGLALTACSKKDADKSKAAAPSGSAADPAKPGDPAKPADPTTPAADAAADPVAAAGVEAGGIERDAAEGPAAVLSAADGTVEVRRVGEPEFAAAAADTALYPGDEVRTGEGGSAQITLADESVIEVAEVSTIGIGSRDGSADPTSSAAVLAGLARFTVTPRAPGEGAFRVYTPAGVVMTKGTVYGIGVAASGQARIGVESGMVDVVGLADVAAPPIEVEGGHAAAMSWDGKVASPSPWTDDDWGSWRDDADASVDLKTVFDTHATALGSLATALASAYADLDGQITAYGDFEAKAAAAADADKPADYEAALPEGSASIDASFGVAGDIEAMTWAYAGRAELAAELAARHPDEAKPHWKVVAPHVDAAVLWPKRFEVTAATTLEPLRVQYYVHHPRGRARADLVGVAVPEFYAKVEPPEVDEVKVRARVRTHTWKRPQVIVKVQPRPVWIATPQADWKVKVKVKPAPARAKVRWYVRPPKVRATAMVGVEVKAPVVPTVKVVAKAPRAKVRVHGDAAVKVTVGGRIKVRAPDLDAAARARAAVKLEGGVMVRDHRRHGADAAAGVDVQVRDHRDDVAVPAADVDVKVRDHRDDAVKATGEIKGGVDVKVRDHRGDAKDVDVKVRDRRDDAKGKVDVKVKGKVKVETPKVDVKVKVKGGVKVGR